MMGGLGGQALAREGVSVSLTLRSTGSTWMGQLCPGNEEQQFLMTELSISTGPPHDQGCFCSSNLRVYVSE